MNRSCPYCSPIPSSSANRPAVIRCGYFKRTSDSRILQRLRCTICLRSFSLATHNACYRQKKRNKNERLRRLLASGVSLRRAARELHLSRTTVARKLIFLGAQSKKALRQMNFESHKAAVVEFDDLETFEHTKCKPLSITLAVESKTRRILGFRISQMNAKGHLAKIALKKYGRRKDSRSLNRALLFTDLKDFVIGDAVLKSDQNPHYIPDVKKYFPNATHLNFKGQRGSIVGQGELKKVRFDPLFSLNHTCAMARANINRLFRRTWCTTKIPARLEDHFAIYAVYHNQNLKQPPTSTA